MKLEIQWKEWSWKVRAEVGNVLITLYCIENFPTPIGNFQLKWKISNFRFSNLKIPHFSFFPTALSNYMYPNYIIDVCWWHLDNDEKDKLAKSILLTDSLHRESHQHKIISDNMSPTLLSPDKPLRKTSVRMKNKSPLQA